MLCKALRNAFNRIRSDNLMPDNLDGDEKLDIRRWFPVFFNELFGQGADEQQTQFSTLQTCGNLQQYFPPQK